MPCAASPPSTFCQEKVATSNFSQSILSRTRQRSRRRWSDPRGRLDPVAIGNAHAGGGAVPGEHHVAVEIELGKIGQLAVGALEKARTSLSLIARPIGDPIAAKRFPGEHIDAARAEKRPQRHLHRAGVGSRHDGRR